MTKNKTYLGDGLYATYDGFAVWLTAPRVRGDGTPEDHVVALEPDVLANFISYALTVPRLSKVIRTTVRERPEFEAGGCAPPILASKIDD
jgi:hypothetical protein